jgi:hypothetical protein
VLTLDEHAIVVGGGCSARVLSAAGPDVPGADALEVGLKADRFLLARAEPETDGRREDRARDLRERPDGALFFERVRARSRSSIPRRSGSRAPRVARLVGAAPAHRSRARSWVAHHGALLRRSARTWPGLGYPGPPDPRRAPPRVRRSARRSRCARRTRPRREAREHLHRRPRRPPTSSSSATSASIGSGAGGAVVAQRLATAGKSVIVLEDGGFHVRARAST